MRTPLRRSALPAALGCLAILPASAAAQSGYDPAVAVSPSQVTTADAITITWRRPASPTKPDLWSLCRTTGGDCRTGATADASAAIGGLTEGAYDFELVAEGTGLFYKGRVPIVVDRTAPGTPRVIDWRTPPASGGTMRPVFEAAEPQNAPVVAVRWTRCVGGALPGSPGCLEGRSTPTSVAIPIDPVPLDLCGRPTQSWSVALWLVDGAGNENRAAATATVSPPVPAIACTPGDPPPPAPRTVALKASGWVRGTAGRRRGRVVVAVPRPAVGTVAVRVIARRGTTRLKAVRSTHTVRAGRASWSLRLPERTTSLLVRATYSGGPGYARARRTFVLRLRPAT